MKSQDFRQISLSEFKRRLSHWVEEAEAGETIEITRHNRTVARIGPAEAASCHTGDRFGKGGIRPLLHYAGILESLWDGRAQDR
ncbi:MAG: type II toxin-antitoxin system prevent-host-death family antitoxin [Planctomycetes bacterium]|nr:type II toxin-antitoxin system prevent-host-death family antitoxin [Planctomycetota bacterium]